MGDSVPPNSVLLGKIIELVVSIVLQRQTQFFVIVVIVVAIVVSRFQLAQPYSHN